MIGPVMLHEDKILDGRYRACQTAGVECRFEDFTGAAAVPLKVTQA